MLFYNRTDISKGIDPPKSNSSKECMVSQYWFLIMGSNVKILCNGCHNLAILYLNINNITIITVKGVDYRCTIHDISKSEAIHLLESSVLDDYGYI